MTRMEASPREMARREGPSGSGRLLVIGRALSEMRHVWITAAARASAVYRALGVIQDILAPTRVARMFVRDERAA